MPKRVGAVRPPGGFSEGGAQQGKAFLSGSKAGAGAKERRPGEGAATAEGGGAPAAAAALDGLRGAHLPAANPPLQQAGPGARRAPPGGPAHLLPLPPMTPASNGASCLAPFSVDRLPLYNLFDFMTKLRLPPPLFPEELLAHAEASQRALELLQASKEKATLVAGTAPGQEEVGGGGRLANEGQPPQEEKKAREEKEKDKGGKTGKGKGEKGAAAAARQEKKKARAPSYMSQAAKARPSKGTCAPPAPRPASTAAAAGAEAPATRAAGGAPEEKESEKRAGEGATAGPAERSPAGSAALGLRESGPKQKGGAGECLGLGLGLGPSLAPKSGGQA
eukprot:jgi/Mesen1/2057/ME000150S01143